MAGYKEQLEFKKLCNQEDLAHEKRLQDQVCEHRRIILKLEREHDLEHRRQMHNQTLSHRKAMFDLELRCRVAKMQADLNHKMMSSTEQPDREDGSPEL